MDGLIAIIKESNDPEEIKVVTDMLNHSVLRLKETIGELSDITHLEKETEKPENVNLAELLEEVKLSIGDILFHSRAKITVDFEEKEIRFSKKFLRSILLNLLSNAVKYRSPDRVLEVDIKSQRTDGFIVLSIQDNGIGIAKEKIGQLFSKFKRVHDLETQVEGTGIGLYLVKKIITNADGKIEVESRLGKGSCFKVYFRP